MSEVYGVAIVGIAGRVPGAGNVRDHWRGFGSAVPAGSGQLERTQLFDAGFFGFNKLEAAVMDPQHRQLLEVSWEALEDAGHPPEQFRGSIGVFAGSGRHTYFTQLVANRKLLEQMGLFLLRHTGNDKDFLTTRISYCLNLTGPSLNVQNGDATSLAAIHLATQSLLNGECEMALAGGVELRLPDAHPEAAAGTGSGAGMVVLRRLQDAMDDGDRIYAVILGSALQQGDPASCRQRALSSAGLRAGEVEFRESDGREAGAASGVLSVIDAALALENGDIAGKAGLGLSAQTGATVQLILGEAPALPPARPQAGAATAQDKPAHLICLSARSAAALDRQTSQFAQFLRDHPTVSLADAAYTLQTGRRAFAHRRTLSCLNRDEAIAGLESIQQRKQVFTRETAGEAPPVTFLFSGGGAQYPSMGREIYATEAVFREQVDECLAIAASLGAGRLRTWLFPEAGGEDAAAVELQKPGNSILSVFVIQYALAQLWISRGIRPAAMIGHSLGEVTAACLAGVMSLEDAIRLVIARGRLFESLPEGGMLSVSLSEAAVRPLIEGTGLCIAAINAADLCVISGPASAISRFEEQLTAREIECQRIRISVAAHSSMIEPFLDAFAREAAEIRFQRPSLAYISNVSGDWAQPEAVAQSGYWVRHLRETVRFADGLESLMKRGGENSILLEVGPGTTMGSLVRRRPSQIEPLVVASLRHPSDAVSDYQFFLAALGKLWAAGCVIDWASCYTKEPRRHVSLPTYPFEAERHWIGEGAGSTAGTAASSGQQDEQLRTAAAGLPVALAKLPELDQWFTRPSWQQAPPAAGEAVIDGNWMVMGRDEPGHREIIEGLRTRGATVVFAVAGNAFLRIGDFDYLVDPISRPCLEFLLSDLADRGLLPRHVVNLLPYTTTGTPKATSGTVKTSLNRDFFSSLTFLQAWGEADLSSPLHFTTVTNGAQSVAGEPVIHPEKAVALGPSRVIPREYPGLTTALVDAGDDTVYLLLNELSSGSPDPLCALRASSGRWVQQMEAGAPGRTADALAANPIRHQGLYLITGGLGGIGLTLAQHLARTAQARLILVGRSPLPAREQWQPWLQTHPVGDVTSARISQILQLEQLGARVRYCAVDLADAAALPTALAGATAGWGPIHGVFHSAGVIDDEIIQLKTRESAEWVFAPKMAGAYALEQALASAAPPDFFVMFSSTSAWLGLAGQADYAGANAFLDAFAQSRNHQQTRTKYLSLAWGVWAEVGMAAKAAGIGAGNFSSGTTAGHPLVGAMTSQSPGFIVHHTRYSARDLWPLNEHRLRPAGSTDGARPALLPGTAYLEIARAALASSAAGEFQPVEIRNLFLSAPLAVPDEGDIPVRVTLRKQEGRWRFTVSSFVKQSWVDHATGEAQTLPAREADRAALDGVRRNCAVRRIEKSPGEAMTRQEQYLAFGPRWDVLQRIDFGRDEVLAACELAPEFRDDLRTFPLHPALLDIAIHAGLELLPQDGRPDRFYAPMSFDRIRAYAPLTRRVLSHVRIKTSLDGGAAAGEVVSFDVAVLSETGETLLQIEDFTVKRIARAALTGAEESERGPSLLQQWLPHGILPAEGMQALDRALAAGTTGSLMVSSIDLRLLRASLDPRAAAKNTGAGTAPGMGGGEASAPRDAYERALCGLFQDLLGIENCGIYDNFFDLGGHSLVAVRLFNRLRKLYSVELGLAVLFQAPTVEQLAVLVRERLGVAFEAAEQAEPGRTTDAAGSHAARSSSSSSSQLEAGPMMVPPRQAPRSACLVPIQPKGRKRPLFLMPGWGGNVIGFQALSRHLGKDQPVYGLQSYGLDGQHAPHTGMEQIAAHFIKEIRSVQPTGPYFLGGMSFGGMVAFEMTQQLEQAGEEVAVLALFDTLLDRKELGNVGSWSSLRARTGFLYRRVRFHAGHLLRSSAREKTEYLRKIGHRFLRRRNSRAWQKNNKIQQVVDQLQAGIQLDLPQAFRVVNESNLAAMKNYSPQPLKTATASLFRAADQGLAGEFDSVTNWQYLVPRGLRVHTVPGNHLTIIDEPNVRELSLKLMEEIRVAEERRQGAHPVPAPALVRAV